MLDDLPPRPRSDRTRSTPGPGSADAGDDAQRELTHHRELLRERLEREGMDPEEAAREARRRLRETEARVERTARRGKVTKKVRERLSGWMEDVRISLRGLRRRPGHALSTLVALGIGIGGSALVLSLVDAIFLNPLPIPDLDRIVVVHQVTDEDGERFPVSYPSYLDYRNALRGDVDLAGYRGFQIGVEVGDRSIEADAAAVSGNYFDALGLRPAAGRLLVSEDERRGVAPVVVLGHDLWEDRFGGDPDLVGRTLGIGAGSATVVGVAPEGFRGHRLDRDEQIWFPIPATTELTSGLFAAPNALDVRFLSWIQPIARLGAAGSPGRLVDRLSSVRRSLAESLGEEGMPEVPQGVPLFASVPLRDHSLGGDRERLFDFLRVVTLLSLFTLVVGTLNATQLRLADLRARSRELGIRWALGASRGRIVRQLLTDVLPLVVGGAVLGLLLARAVLGALRRFTLPGGVSLDRLPLSLDVGLLGILALVAGAVLVIAGLLPAWLGSRDDPARLIRRGMPGWSTGLVAAQVAVSTALVVSAALFLRSFARGIDTELGFDADGLVAVTMSAEAHGYDAGPLADRLYEVASRVGGVRSVALASHVPLAPWDFALAPIRGGEEERYDGPEIGINTVMGPFLTTLGIPIVRGRDLSPDDDPEEPVAVVNQAAAKLLWPGRSPLGRYLRLFSFDADSSRVVGVAADARARHVGEESPPFIYLDARSYAGLTFDRTAHVVARTDRPDETLGALRGALSAELPGLPVIRARRVSRQVEQVLMPQHLGAILFGVFGAFAALLAATGVAGVTIFELRRRRREMGIRHALGAGRLRSAAPALRGTAVATGVGFVSGLFVVTWIAGRWLESYLVGIALFDPVATTAALTVVVGGVALAVTWAFSRQRGLEPSRILAAEGAPDRL